MSTNSGRVAYIVVAWNNRGIIGECLDAIEKQTYKHGDIYLIDNASADGTADYVAKEYPNVHLIRSEVNTAFAKGNNIAIKEALKDKNVKHIALINSDAVLDKNWTEKLVEYLHDKPNFAGAQGLTLDYYNHDIVDAKYIYIEPNFQAVQYGYGKKTKDIDHDKAEKVFGVNAAAAVYSREFIEQQPGKLLFDEKLYMYLEDMDVAIRSIITGWDNYFVPGAKAYHMGSVSAKKRSNGYNIKMTFRNQAAILYKHLPYRVFKNYLLAALKFERHFYAHLIKSHGYRVLWMAIRGRFLGILRLPIYHKDRKRLMNKMKISSEDLEKIIKNRGVLD